MPIHRDTDVRSALRDYEAGERLRYGAASRRPGVGVGRRSGFRGYGGGGAAPAESFDPPTTNLVMGLWDEGIVLTSGKVSQWTDQSGTGNSVTQGTASKRPVVSSADADFGGRDVVQFAGGASNEHMVGTFVATYAQPFTAYMLFKLTGSGTTYVLWDDDGLSDWNFFFSGGEFKGGAGATLSTGVTTKNDLHLVCVVYNGGSTSIYIDDFDTAAVTGNGGSNSARDVTVGSNDAEAGEIEGKVASMLLYNAAHDSTTRNEVRSKFNEYYSLGLA